MIGAGVTLYEALKAADQLAAQVLVPYSFFPFIVLSLLFYFS